MVSLSFLYDIQRTVSMVYATKRCIFYVPYWYDVYHVPRSIIYIAYVVTALYTSIYTVGILYVCVYIMYIPGVYTYVLYMRIYSRYASCCTIV